ncbi:hypothetical protein BpOF4_08790 [Alkalihalophilus pseudofirmus OF4]|uniref:Uncharacterized protein n=1 Tax=Alkalihalophilus pseudofirmus (strain ATCC BAA-2126 / JCM 17055 / OF4) TaxID=398511 RepID=D3FRQ6_ALKPO|nr:MULTISPECIES: hypothetical protein [Alkalihalophilus]ADC49816.1 hypothetical protein BpOF4_08790 [Alkalihalophilus pseudofirmus OF4]MED1600899.1 hypothetical protein [Alkalihalophilus marmarensis]
MNLDQEMLQADLIKKFQYVKNQARNETRLEVAERMIDYGIDLQLVRTVTGLTAEELKSRSTR